MATVTRLERKVDDLQRNIAERNAQNTILSDLIAYLNQVNTALQRQICQLSNRIEMGHLQQAILTEETGRVRVTMSTLILSNSLLLDRLDRLLEDFQSPGSLI